MRRAWLPSLLSLFLVTTASANERTANPGELAPSQTEIGAYAAGFKLDTFRAQANEKGIAFEKYVRGDLAAKFAAKPIPAIIDPSGQLRVLDGHHKLSALRTIEREMGIVVPVKLNIVKDYSGYSFDAYAKHFVGKLGKGYFGKNPPRSATAKMRRLPSSFDKLVDNPLRSILGVAFTKSGLEGSWFSDYVQFHLGETMLNNGLLADMKKAGLLGSDGAIPSLAAGDKKTVAFITQRLFSSAKLTGFLRQRILGASHTDATTAMNRAQRAAKAAPARRSLGRSRARTASKRGQAGTPRRRARSSRPRVQTRAAAKR